MNEDTKRIDGYEEEDLLSNLYISLKDLHASLDLREVVRVMLEISVNLIGSPSVYVAIYDEEQGLYIPVSAAGSELPKEGLISLGGEVGAALRRGEVLLNKVGAPAAVVPMNIAGKPFAVLVFKEFLGHKGGISSLDEQLFEMLSIQGATALYSACLFSMFTPDIRAEDILSKLED